MKASELIEALQNLIANEGDVSIYYHCDPGCHIQQVDEVATSTKAEGRYYPESFGHKLPDIFAIVYGSGE